MIKKLIKKFNLKPPFQTVADVRGLVFFIIGFLTLITTSYLTIAIRGYIFHPDDPIVIDCLIRAIMVLGALITIVAFYFKTKPMLDKLEKK